jgi:hypothetical protein
MPYERGENASAPSQCRPRRREEWPSAWSSVRECHLSLRHTRSVVFRVIFAVLGLMLLVPGVLQARAWRMSGGEPHFVRAGVGILAASRVLAGTAFVFGGVVASRPLIVAGAVCLLLGSASAAVARRQLKRV